MVARCSHSLQARSSHGPECIASELTSGLLVRLSGSVNGVFSGSQKDHIDEDSAFGEVPYRGSYTPRVGCALLGLVLSRSLSSEGLTRIPCQGLRFMQSARENEERKKFGPR